MTESNEEKEEDGTIRMSREVVKVVYPEDQEQQSYDNLRVSIITLDERIPEKVLKVLFSLNSKKRVRVRMSTLSGKFYCMGIKVMVVSDMYAYPVYMRIDSIEDATQFQNNEGIHNITLSKVFEGAD